MDRFAEPRDDGKGMIGAYDARFLNDMLVWLRAKTAHLGPAERDLLLQRANRLPELHGCFKQATDGKLLFLPTAARPPPPPP